MKKSGSGFVGPSNAAFHRGHLPGGRTPAALDRVAHVDTAAPHGGDIRRQVVALQNHVADAAARRDEVRQTGMRVARPPLAAFCSA